MEKQVFTVNAFNGGLNTKVSSIHGAPNESPSLKNVNMDLYGAVGTRAGCTAVATLTTSFWGLQNYTPSTGTAYLLGYSEDTNGYLWNSATTLAVVSGMTGILSHPSMAMSRQFQDKIFLSDGYMTPVKYDGTYVYDWGITALATAPLCSGIGTPGLLTGLYRYVILGENQYAAKGNYGTATVTFSAASNSINLYNIPVFSASVGISKKWIARNVASAAGVYYLVTSVTNAITTFTDNTADSLLVDLAPVDNYPPSKFTYFVPFQGRMFGACSTGAYKSRVYYSAINDPEIWHTEDWFEIGQGDGMTISGLGVVNNGIVIQKSDAYGRGAMYLLYMPNTTSDNWSMVKLDVAHGGMAPKAMTNFMHYMSYVSSQGVYTISEDAQSGATVNVPISLKIDPSFLLLTKTLLHKAASISYKNKLYISVPSSAATTYNDYIYVYDYLSALLGQEGAGMWSLYTGKSISDFSEFSGALYGSSNDGHIYQLETGHADYGTAIDSAYDTMIIWGNEGHQNYYKNWRFLYVTVDTAGAWNMQISYSPNFIDGSWSVENVDLTQGGAIFSDNPAATGAAIFGSSYFGGGTTQSKVKIILNNASSRNIQIKFSTNVANQYFKVHDLELHYTLRSIR